MQLELISRPATRPRCDTPLLFIHGIFSCAGIWEPYFLPFFAHNGYHAHALSLRGHGASAGRERLASSSLRDYLADVEQVAASFDRPPVLVGASMGGVIVQHFLQRQPAAAAVLLGSGPPHGMWFNSLWMMLANPLLAGQLSLMSLFGTDTPSADMARRALFLPDTPDRYIQQFLHYAQPESQRVMLDLLGWDLPPQRQSNPPPTLVIGAEHDAFISAESVRQTARAFDTEAMIIPGIAHGMMLDPNWQRVAQPMLDWLETQRTTLD